MQRRIVQLVVTDTYVFGIDADGRAWKALRTGGGNILEWQPLPALPDKPTPAKKTTRKKSG